MRTALRSAATGNRVAVAAITLSFVISYAAAIVLAPAANATETDADISIIGGTSNSSVVCGNVAEAKDLAARRGITLQRNNCTADSNGGNVTLANVDIIISAAARAANPGNSALADLAAGVAPKDRVAADACKNSAGRSGREIQRNICWGKGYGGRGRTNGAVVGLVQHADGTLTRRTFSAARIPLDDGVAAARCTNIVAELRNQQDECSSSGTGASLALKGVTVVEHHGDGSSTTKRNIDLTVRGGTATSTTYCFNVIDGTGRVVQINVCKGTATGGDVTLTNVTVLTTA